MKLFPALLFAGLLAGGPLSASELDLSLNADAVKLRGGFDLTNNIQVGGSWLYHQDKGHALTADAYITGNAAPGVQTTMSAPRLSSPISYGSSEAQNLAISSWLHFLPKGLRLSPIGVPITILLLKVCPAPRYLTAPRPDL